MSKLRELELNIMSAKYVAFDCETTGIDPKRCQLLTASFWVLDGDLIEIDRVNISLKSDTGYYVFPEALKVNKINLIEHNESAMSLMTAKETLFTFLKKHKGTYTLVPIGHNINFDLDFIMSSRLMDKEDIQKYFSYGMIDTMVVSQFLKLCDKLPQRQRISLTSLSGYYMNESERNKNQEHSAEYDVGMTVSVLKRMRDSVAGTATTNFVEEGVRKKRKLV